MFAAQFEELPEKYRCIAWDMRDTAAANVPTDRG